MTAPEPANLILDEQVTYALWKVSEGKQPVRFLTPLSLKDANRLAESYNNDGAPGVTYHAARELTLTAVEFDPADSIDHTTRPQALMALDGLSRLIAESDTHLD
jgi:hypothetical protein